MPQSLAKICIHTIFSTKNRTPLLADDWRDELLHVLGGTTNNLGCQSLIVGGVADHVHLLFQLARTITVADALSKIKSTSSLWINQSRSLPAPFHWQAGYGAFLSANPISKPCAITSAGSRSIMHGNHSRTNCANGCADMKWNGTNDTFGINVHHERSFQDRMGMGCSGCCPAKQPGH